MVVKSRSIAGFDAPYVPGWDCHGMPIEIQIEKQYGKNLPTAEVLSKARAYAHESASRLAAFNYAGVVFTYMLEVALFRRVPETHQIVGALVVIGAGVMVSVLAARRVAAPLAQEPAE